MRAKPHKESLKIPGKKAGRRLNRLARAFRHRPNEAQRDENGLSIRQRAFHLFNRGISWQKAAVALSGKPETIRRYHQTWKKLPRYLEPFLEKLSNTLKIPEEKSKVLKTLSTKLGIPVPQVEQILLRPWGLRSLVLSIYGVKTIVPSPKEKELASYAELRRLIIKSGRTPEEVFDYMQLTADIFKGDVDWSFLVAKVFMKRDKYPINRE